MHLWFFICVLGIFAIIPLYFVSVEHLKLRERYGEKKGTRIGDVCGIISGWGFFLLWIGIWFSPQPRFAIPISQSVLVSIPLANLTIPLLNIIVSGIFLLPGAWLGIEGARELTLKVSETHRAEEVVAKGVYSIVRHPQYLGGLLAHVGISFTLSAWYSLLFTPLMMIVVYMISKKEEKELAKEFGNEYDEYKKKVPMLVPRLRR